MIETEYKKLASDALSDLHLFRIWGIFSTEMFSRVKVCEPCLSCSIYLLDKVVNVHLGEYVLHLRIFYHEFCITQTDIAPPKIDRVQLMI